MRLIHEIPGQVLVVRHGGGCVGAIGAAFSLWVGLLGGFALWGGLLEGEGPVVSGALIAVLALFVLAGLALVTWRRNFTFDRRSRSAERTTHLLLVRQIRRVAPFDAFSAVELRKDYRATRSGLTRRVHVVGLTPSPDSDERPEAWEVGAWNARGEAGKIARELAEHLDLPVKEITAR